jgi:glycosyltransferase involved in cell wall biosynthesis
LRDLLLRAITGREFCGKGTFAKTLTIRIDQQGIYTKWFPKCYKGVLPFKRGMILIIGVFSPEINLCYGTTWVDINIVNALKEYGHQVIILTNKPLDQKKLVNVFNRPLPVDQQIVFPLALFPPPDYHNIYADVIRCLLLKFKCEVLIDTHSNAILPGIDVAYIHYPLLKRVARQLPRLRNKIYFYPYRSFLNFRRKDINSKLIFANSKFTAEAIKAEFGIKPYILYPPVGSDFLNRNETEFNGQRDNIVTAIARISERENLKIIPYIAKSISKEVSFNIVGLLGSNEVLGSLIKLVKELKLSERVKILTNVERERLRRMLLNSKVYLHPVINEHFGISIVEAMSCGCIPVVHDSGGPREFVPEDLRYKSIEEAAKKVEKAINDWTPEQANRISKIAIKFSENNFSKRFVSIFHSHFG